VARLRNRREGVEDTHGMSFASVFAYEVEPEGRAAAGEEYVRRSEAAKRLWRREQVIGRFEAV
jgi:hypothetical protein